MSEVLSGIFYSEIAVNSDPVIQELVKVRDKVEKIESPDKFKLTSTFNVFGDSWVVPSADQGYGISFPEQLSSITGKVVNQVGQSGKGIAAALAEPSIINFLVEGPLAADRSTIFNYGINTYRDEGEGDFNTAYPLISKCYLGTFIQAAVPQSQIYNTRDNTLFTKTGTWTTPTNTLAIGTSATSTNATITLSSKNCRYISPLFYSLLGADAGASDENWDIEVSKDGGDFEYAYGIDMKYQSHNSSQNYFAQGYIIDMVDVADYSVRFTAKTGAVDNEHYLLSVSCWTGDETTKRDVLAVAPPLFDYISSSVPGPSPTFDAYQGVRHAIESSVKACKASGLNVYVHIPVETISYKFDSLHMSTIGARSFANDILVNSTEGY